MMRFHLRVDDSNPAHIRFSVFANGARCGQLVMRPDEYSTFGRGLLLGCHDIRPHTSVQVDTYTLPAPALTDGAVMAGERVEVTLRGEGE